MLAEFTPLNSGQLAFAVLTVFSAYAVKGFSGFGAGLVAIPLLVLIMPIQIVVPAVSLLSYGGNVLQAFALRKNVSWHDLWPLAPFSLLGVVTAVWLLTNVNANQLALALGVFVFIYALYSLFPLVDLTGSRRWAVPIGCCGGLVGALFGSGGFIYVVYLKLRQLDKARFRASVAMTLFIDGTFRISGYTLSNLYSETTLWLVVILFPVLMIAMLAGHFLQAHINRHRFNQIVCALLMGSSGLLIYKSLSA